MRVRFTEPALNDLEAIYAYVSSESPRAASRIVTRLVERAQLLRHHPHLGRVTDEPGVRVILVPRFHYRIFYSLSHDEIRVLHIRHTSRKPWSGDQ